MYEYIWLSVRARIYIYLIIHIYIYIREVHENAFSISFHVSSFFSLRVGWRTRAESVIWIVFDLPLEWILQFPFNIEYLSVNNDRNTYSRFKHVMHVVHVERSLTSSVYKLSIHLIWIHRIIYYSTHRLDLILISNCIYKHVCNNFFRDFLRCVLNWEAKHLREPHLPRESWTLVLYNDTVFKKQLS